jgi:hypothetical protein
MFLENSITTTCNDRAFGVDLHSFSLPVGWCDRDRACLKCGSKELVGALISESADTLDPDVLCTICGYYV